MRASRTFAALLAGIALAGFVEGCDQPTQTPASPEAQAVASAKTSLAITFASGDNENSVTGNLTLPTTATGDVTISWASSNASVISVSGGAATVKRLIGQPGSAALTATITKGSAMDTKVFSLTVKALTLVVKNDWTTFDGTASPFVTCVARSENSLYAGTKQNDFFYSDDLGETWHQFQLTAAGDTPDEVTVIKVSGKVVLIGTKGGFYKWDRTSGNGIEKSTPVIYVSDLVIEGGKAYVASFQGLYTYNISDLSSIATASTSFDCPDKLFSCDGYLYVTGANSTSGNTEELDRYNESDMSQTPEKLDVVPDRVYPYGGPVYRNGATTLVGILSALYREGAGDTAFSLSSTDFTAVDAFAYDGANLFTIGFGSDLWYSRDLGATWASVKIPGHENDCIDGIRASGIVCNGFSILIPYSSGLVMAAFE